MSNISLRRLLLATLFVFLGGLGVACSEKSPEFDTVIRNGLLIDGSGAPGVIADVGIKGDRIAAIGDLSDSQGEQEIDAEGLGASSTVRVPL